jgi:hypothetical protein
MMRCKEEQNKWQNWFTTCERREVEALTTDADGYNPEGVLRGNDGYNERSKNKKGQLRKKADE